MAHTRTALSVALLMLAGCGTDLSVLGPTPPDQGIVIFMHADYAGSSQAVNVDVHDLTKTEGPCSSGAEGESPTWRNCVSSVRVFPGWSATLYRDEDFKGGVSFWSPTRRTSATCQARATAASTTASDRSA